MADVIVRDTAGREATVHTTQHHRFATTAARALPVCGHSLLQWIGTCGKDLKWNGKMQTWVCGDRDAAGTNCGESKTFQYNWKSGKLDQYDDGVRQGGILQGIANFIGDHAGAIIEGTLLALTIVSLAIPIAGLAMTAFTAGELGAATAAEAGVAVAEAGAETAVREVATDTAASAFSDAMASEGATVASSAGGASGPWTQLGVLRASDQYETVINDLKGLTHLSGNEHALVELENGEVAIGSGGPGGITSIPGRVIMHTHPTSAGPSAIDMAAAQAQEGGMYVLHGGDITYVPGSQY